MGRKRRAAEGGAIPPGSELCAADARIADALRR